MQSCAKVYNDSPCAVLGLQGPVTSSRLNKVDRGCGWLQAICRNAPCFTCSYLISFVSGVHHETSSPQFLIIIPYPQHIQHLGAQAFRELSKCTHPDRLRGRLERPPSKEEALGSWEAERCESMSGVLLLLEYIIPKLFTAGFEVNVC